MYIKWITIQVKDMDTSKEFYKNFLGLTELRAFSPCPGKQIVFLGLDGGGQIELICDEARENHGEQQSVSLGIAVRDFDLLYQKAAETQVPHSEPQIKRKNTKCFFLTDPNGVRLQIIKGTEA